MKRIEICGGIATGKTSLARSLAQHGPYQLVEERFREVPFWEKFYTAPSDAARAEYAFQKNISFLLFHAESIREAERTELRDLVCDFAIFQDLAYAKPFSDYDVIRSVYDKLTKLIHFPTTIIKLDCDPAVQLERIRRRGRKQEQTINHSQLVALNKKIDESLAELLDECRNNQKDERKIEIVELNTGERDFVTNQEAERIAARVGELMHD